MRAETRILGLPRMPEQYTLSMAKQLLQGQQLEQRARELGVDIQGAPITSSSSGRHPAADHELQQRVNEAERAIRESRLWIVAVISTVVALFSAAASVVSALAAWEALRK